MAKKTLTIGSKVKFAHGSEPHAMAKNKAKVHTITNIVLITDESGSKTTHPYIYLDNHEFPYFSIDLECADEQVGSSEELTANSNCQLNQLVGSL